MSSELRHALAQTDGSDLKAWGAETGRDFLRCGWNRLSNTGRLLQRVGVASLKEASDAITAYRGKRLGEHVSERGCEVVDATHDLYARTRQTVTALSRCMKDNPSEAGPQLLTVVMTSVIVSGGVDGNGGAPDLDLLAGIGAHRSILTHSLLMGTALETGLLSLLHLTQLIHAKLPVQHDPLWDALLAKSSSLMDAARTGVGVGMAYHLLVDGIAQPAAYKDLPVEMPIEAHQSIFVANATAELANTRRLVNKNETNSAPADALGGEVYNSFEAAQQYARDYCIRYKRSPQVVRFGIGWIARLPSL